MFQFHCRSAFRRVEAAEIAAKAAPKGGRIGDLQEPPVIDAT